MPHAPASLESSTAGGFTLVEVLVSVGLVSVLVAGAAGLLASASGAIRKGRLATTAAAIAMQKVEQLRANPGAAGGVFEDGVHADGAPGPAASTLFVRRWTVSPGPAPAQVAVLVEVFSRNAGRLVQLHALMGAGASGRAGTQ